MKLTIQKILICALSLILSIAACVCGMYMTILANMLMRYRILFCLFFILNPVLVIFMIRFMFKKPVPKEETEGSAEPEKKKKWGFSKKEESQPAEPEYIQDEEPDTSAVSYSNGTVAEGTYSDSAYSDSNYGASDYTAPSAAESVDETVSVQESPEVHFGASSFAGELDDDIDLSGSVTEKTTGSVTEDSVAKFKKISLKRKKRADE
ncbi:MAG: hypothetical protein IKF10_03890 [Lachnospiraceae bacterium]|nr:hypothetical protein [Lachnospiraceae bacterium]